MTTRDTPAAFVTALGSLAASPLTEDVAEQIRLELASADPAARAAVRHQCLGRPELTVVVRGQV